jgi:hypothetical protein
MHELKANKKQYYTCRVVKRKEKKKRKKEKERTYTIIIKLKQETIIIKLKKDTRQLTTRNREIATSAKLPFLRCFYLSSELCSSRSAAPHNFSLLF